MIGRRSATIVISSALSLFTAACLSSYEVPVETPSRATLDTSPFRRVLVAGFLSGGTDEIDTNVETVRLLRSQLRSKSRLHVIDAGVLPLADVAEAERSGLSEAPEESASRSAGATRHQNTQALAEDESIFANAAFWKKIGEEYQEPLIITGSLRFASQVRRELEQRTDEQFDPFGRRGTAVVQQGFLERAVFILAPTFVFIDGQTGAVLHRESFTEEVAYGLTQNVPALSAYFELMDRVVPSFLRTLTDQRIQSFRFLLK